MSKHNVNDSFYMMTQDKIVKKSFKNEIDVFLRHNSIVIANR